MKKKIIFQVVGLALVASAMVGCRSNPWDPYANVGGVHGESGDYGYEMGIPVSEERMVGGDEHANMFTAVYFGYDSNAIQGAERAKLEEVAAYLQTEKDVAVIIDGHCDDRGSREYNLALGERRALAVREYLIGLGVAADRIQTRTMGEEQPAVAGHNEAAWAQNRRAEFIIYY